VYNYDDSCAYGYKWSAILYLLDGLFGWEWNEMVLVQPVWSRMIYKTSLWIIL
jgi:hypothetical protein